jgi:hypothetical protein
MVKEEIVMSEGQTSNSKECRECKKIKPFSAFHKDMYSKDGRKRRCGDCCKVYAAKAYKTLISPQFENNAEVTSAKWLKKNIVKRRSINHA